MLFSNRKAQHLIHLEDLIRNLVPNQVEGDLLRDNAQSVFWLGFHGIYLEFLMYSYYFM